MFEPSLSGQATITSETFYPNLAIRSITGQSNGQPIGGGVWLKGGSGWGSGFTGNVGSLTAAVNTGGVNGTVTYDFEP